MIRPNSESDAQHSATTPESALQQPADTTQAPAAPAAAPVEIGGRGGAEPTRFGDWEKNGRCIDF